MISKLLYAFENGLKYVKKHPQIALILASSVVFALLFFWSGQQFLEAGRANQDRLQKDRIGLLHDAFVAVIRSTQADQALMQEQINALVTDNPDLTKFRVVRHDPDGIRILAAYDVDLMNELEVSVDPYRYSAINLNESFIVEIGHDGNRYWQGFRSFELSDGSVLTILTEQSLAVVDELFKAREQDAYYSLIVIYVFIFAFTYWHIRLTDYRYLYQKVAKANEMKDMFTNMIAHELRAPITAIRGYASLLAESKDTTPTQQEHVRRISESSMRLLGVINDFLDVARMQSGKLKLQVSTVDVSQVVREVCNELSVTAAAKKITLLTTDADRPHFITTDSKRLHQILVNLINNSIKYTNEGSIEIAIFEIETKLEIRIKDTGIGIHAHDQKELFSPFYRVDGKEVETVTGTGLGMWITKQLVDLLEAQIGVESIKNVGTHVVITFSKNKKVAE